MEADDTMGSRAGLGIARPSGYLKLVREAGRRGLLGSVVRPGYILGNTATAVRNNDDFLTRRLKGCHVARVVVLASFNPVSAETGTSGGDVGVHVVHVTAHPRLCMNKYLSTLNYYGYDVPEFHVAINDLPSTTRTPEFDDHNAVTVLKTDVDRWTNIDECAGEGISQETVGRF
ncbi:L-2-aminoadipate reductase [Metarhizium brunneum]|uniref:L-2-aminoadipate reductase n=1 Tax=Metarhizium brunneum TaxID=500148 RepID=A0A7D5YRG6_9HYPO|nr:L-2-aminoadipate reductase [Metarhizium brunneum]